MRIQYVIVTVVGDGSLNIYTLELPLGPSHHEIDTVCYK
jgi:hypothetical protein